MAQRLECDGSPEERRRFGEKLTAVLDYADPGGREADLEETRWDEFWRLAGSLMFDPENTPIAIVDGKLVERDLEFLTPDTRTRLIAAKRRRLRRAGAVTAHNGRR